MTRYAAIQPRLWVSATNVPEDRPSCIVYAADLEPIHTGLLNADGVPLYRLPECTPLGFCREKLR